MPMTENEIRLKRTRKRVRRERRAKERTPEQEQLRILRGVEAVVKGHEGLKKLFAPLALKEDERHAYEENERRDREAAHTTLGSGK